MPDRSHPVVSVAQMVAAEQALFDQRISVDALMLRAGQGAGEYVWRIGGRTPTLVLCGPGNNGGDGYVIAEFLREKGVPVTVAALADPRTEAARNARMAYRGEVMPFGDAVPHAQLVDCLFGSGLSRALDDGLWDHFSHLAAKAGRSYAGDLPSGVDADRAIWLNAPVHFDHVLALGAFKYAHLLEPGASACGSVSLVNIGVDLSACPVTRIAKPRIAAPDAQSHKYRRGLVAIVAGAMPGAALLAARAAQGSGAGYVRLIGRGPPPAMLAPDLVWHRADNRAALVEALSDERIGSVLVGPGLGRDADAGDALDVTLNTAHPLVIDADALHLLAQRATWPLAREAAVVMTPHHGEFTALAKSHADQPAAINKAVLTAAMARASGAHVLYKGADSVMASPDGATVIADRRCTWLSVAGTGDVLAGSIAARLASHGDPFAAMTEAVWLHDRAARNAGPAFTALQLAGAMAAAVEACVER